MSLHEVQINHNSLPHSHMQYGQFGNPNANLMNDSHDDSHLRHSPFPSNNKMQSKSMEQSEAVDHLSHMQHHFDNEQMNNPYDQEINGIKRKRSAEPEAKDPNSQMNIMNITSNNADNANRHETRKRTKISPEQLLVLELTFETNSSPNLKLRKELSTKLNMNERTIQVWFQNKRAKVKLEQKNKALSELGGMVGNIENHLQEKNSRKEMMNIYLLANEGQNGPYPSYSSPLHTTNKQVMLNTGAALLIDENQGHQQRAETTPCELSANIISIGSWKRQNARQGNLSCFYNLQYRCFYWLVSDGPYEFKMEVPFNCVVNIQFDTDNTRDQGIISIDTNEIPTFSMKPKEAFGVKWKLCQDFTEGKQASKFFKHFLYGNLDPLLRQIIRLTKSDIGLCNVTTIPQESINQSTANEQLPLHKGGPKLVSNDTHHEVPHTMNDQTEGLLLVSPYPMRRGCSTPVSFAYSGYAPIDPVYDQRSDVDNNYYSSSIFDHSSVNLDSLTDHLVSDY